MPHGIEREKILTHLFDDYTEPIRDPLWRHIYFYKPFLKLVETPQFQKLLSVKQLGPAYLVYPGSTHSRFSHSLGVFHIARRMVSELVRKQKDDFFSLSGVKAFLCASLLHDVGHYPYAHSLKDLDVESHEKLTAKKILASPITAILKNSCDVEPYTVAAIIDHDLDCTNEPCIPYFRSLLSGVLDPDKLDYLNRDAFHCGIPYGVQDVDYILGEIHPHLKKGIAVTERGLLSIESILFSKYLMYKTVYWHKTVRIATAMIKKAIWLALNDGVIDKTELYDLDDNELFTLARSKNYTPFRLIEDVLKRNLHKQVFRIKFEADDTHHSRIENLDKRIDLEKKIAAMLAQTTHINITSEDIIIDIPERVSFEIDVPVINIESSAEIPFAESGSVFNTETVANFSTSLRYISVSVARKPQLLDAVRGFEFIEFLRGEKFG